MQLAANPSVDVVPLRVRRALCLGLALLLLVTWTSAAHCGLHCSLVRSADGVHPSAHAEPPGAPPRAPAARAHADAAPVPATHVAHDGGGPVLRAAHDGGGPVLPVAKADPSRASACHAAPSPMIAAFPRADAVVAVEATCAAAPPRFTSRDEPPPDPPPRSAVRRASAGIDCDPAHRAPTRAA